MKNRRCRAFSVDMATGPDQRLEPCPQDCLNSPVQPLQRKAIPMSLPEFQPVNLENGASQTEGETIILSAKGMTDFFTNPDGSPPVGNAPVLAVPVDGPVFSLTVRLSVELKTTYDAGGLLVRAGAGRWAKLAFERSPLGRSTIVTVVTKDTSDDCNGEETEAESLWLRLYRQGPVLAFHWSLDGRFFKLARLFSMGQDIPDLSVGLLAQSPMGPGCTVRFDRIAIAHSTIDDLRNGA